jgi:Ser-tRNA(Ala) deacylase AlaX
MSARATELLFLHDAYAESCTATVMDVVTDSDSPRRAPDRTTFYPTSGGRLTEVSGNP